MLRGRHCSFQYRNSLESLELNSRSSEMTIYFIADIINIFIYEDNGIYYTYYDSDCHSKYDVEILNCIYQSKRKSNTYFDFRNTI